jgi:hypothetical protein
MAVLSTVLRIEDCLRQIGELIRCESVAFDAGNQFPPAVDDRGTKRVVHQTVIREEVHAKQVTHTLHIRGWPGEKVPGRWIGVPLVRP